MKNFNELEKQILRFIAKEWKNSENLLVYQLYEYVAMQHKTIIEIDYNTKEIHLTTDLEDIYPVFTIEGIHKVYHKHINDILNNLITLYALLDYLEKNNLIYYFEDVDMPWEKVTLNDKQVFDKATTKAQYFSRSLCNRLIENIRQSVMATPELKSFVESDFKDKEQIRHEDNLQLQNRSISVSEELGKKSLKIAIYSLGIAIISLVATFVPILTPYIHNQKTSSTKVETLTDRQFENGNSNDVKVSPARKR